MKMAYLINKGKSVGESDAWIILTIGKYEFVFVFFLSCKSIKFSQPDSLIDASSNWKRNSIPIQLMEKRQIEKIAKR